MALHSALNTLKKIGNNSSLLKSEIVNIKARLAEISIEVGGFSTSITNDGNSPTSTHYGTDTATSLTTMKTEVDAAIAAIILTPALPLD